MYLKNSKKNIQLCRILLRLNTIRYSIISGNYIKIKPSFNLEGKSILSSIMKVKNCRTKTNNSVFLIRTAKGLMTNLDLKSNKNGGVIIAQIRI